MYHIDQGGLDFRWRVWWLRPDGYTAERLFDCREAAEDWVRFMEATEAD